MITLTMPGSASTDAPPRNQVRRHPDGDAIAWYRPEDEHDDTPWLVIEENPHCGVTHEWRTDRHVATWPVLTNSP